MARMLPPACPKTIKSQGEHFIFDQLRDAPDSDNWVCLHSLELSRHIYKVCSEIDFVVMVPGEGVFCLEVKSGGVSRVGGTWLYEDQMGHVHTNYEGPFEQSASAMQSMRKWVNRKFSQKSDPEYRLNQIVYGWGVALPDVEFADPEGEFEPWRVYDLKSRQQPINEYIRRLSHHSHDKFKDQAWYDEKESRPTPTDVERLLRFLRSDFELTVKKGLYAQQLHEEIIRLTGEQTRRLEDLRDNPRCFLRGAAGTGKTVLAVEFAKREAAKGKRVLFLCYNKLLGQRLKGEFLEFNGQVVADTFLHYVDELVLKSSFKDAFIDENLKADDDTRYIELFPFFALEALGEGKEQPFDVLVVDECQDLLIPEYLDIFDGLLAGGLKKGHWAFFGDMLLQNIFNRQVSPEEMISKLEEKAPNNAKFRLSDNCRNTRNIGSDTCRIVGFEEPPYRASAVTGSPVEYLYYRDPAEQTRMIQSIIVDLESEGIGKDDITVLSRRKLEKCSFSDQSPDVDIKFCDITAGVTCRDHKNGVNFCTIQAFKGLENSVIIVTDILDLDKDYVKPLIYVAMSRAHIRLFMLLPKSLKKRIERVLSS